MCHCVDGFIGVHCENGKTQSVVVEHKLAITKR